MTILILLNFGTCSIDLQTFQANNLRQHLTHSSKKSYFHELITKHKRLHKNGLENI